MARLVFERKLAPQLSLTLDLIRLLAACAVVICHFGARRISGGLWWQLNPYGAQAVDVFFVLSGYVVTFAASREPIARRYLVSRAARIWSVAAPALVLTLLLDLAGRHLWPPLYAELPAYAAGHPALALQAASGLLFFNGIWFLDLPVGSNIPWWSLGYEVAYYAAFFCVWYGRGLVRVAAPLALGLLVGPDIVLLAPLWAAGSAVFLLHRRGWPAGWRAVLISAGALLFWCAYEMVVRRYGRPFGAVPRLRPELLQDLLVGLLFAVWLAGLPAWLPQRSCFPLGSQAAARAVRFLAGRSFSLYLLHYPVLLCLHAALLRFAPGLSPIWMLPAMAVIVLGIAEVTEQRKGAWQRALSGILAVAP